MTPRRLELISRMLLIASALVAAGVIAVECAGPMAASTTVKFSIHISLAYVTLSLALLSFPRRRRADLFLMCFVQFAVLELVRFCLGRSDALAGEASDLLGLLCVYLPTELEYHRHLARTNRFMTFTEIRANDRRRAGPQSVGGRSRSRPSALRT